MDAPSPTPRRFWPARRGTGTAYMIVGTLIAAIAAYLFQLVVGRSLGPTEFAPITVLWTFNNFDALRRAGGRAGSWPQTAGWR